MVQLRNDQNSYQACLGRSLHVECLDKTCQDSIAPRQYRMKPAPPGAGRRGRSASAFASSSATDLPNTMRQALGLQAHSRLPCSKHTVLQDGVTH